MKKLLVRIVVWALLALLLVCIPSDIADGSRTCPPAAGGAGLVQKWDAPAGPFR